MTLITDKGKNGLLNPQFREFLLTPTPKTEITADTDTFVFSNSLLITGLKAQWLQAKGLDATFSLGEFRYLLENEKSTDKGAPTLSTSQQFGNVLMSENNVVDGNYPAN
jgi:hypothetical protein